MRLIAGLATAASRPSTAKFHVGTSSGSGELRPAGWSYPIDCLVRESLGQTEP